MKKKLRSICFIVVFALFLNYNNVYGKPISLSNNFLAKNYYSTLFNSNSTLPEQSNDIICGVITENTTWTKENSPYILSCNTTVDANVTLSVEPGVEIFIETNVIFFIDGTLNLNGTAGDSILIKGNGNGDFSEIKIRGNGKIEAQYTKVSEAQTAFKLEDSSQPFSLCNSIIEHCEIAILQLKGSQANTIIDSVIFRNNNKGIVINSGWSNTSFSITNCSFFNHLSRAIELDTEAYLRDYIRNCLFSENRTAIYLSDAKYFRITNSEFRNNTFALSNFYCNNIYVYESTIINNDIGFNFKGGSGYFYYNEIRNNNIGVSCNTFRYHLNYNYFTQNSEYNIRITGDDGFSFPLNAQYNDFGSLNESEIESSIYDYYDDQSLIKVDYSNFGVPYPPIEFRAIQKDIKNIELKWTDKSNSETSYEIYKSINNTSSFRLLCSLEPNSDFYNDTLIELGNTYYYKINAINNYGASKEIDYLEIINNYFTEQTSISLPAIKNNSSASWGDYDNDGDLDILLTGNTSQGPISKIYRNDNDNIFTEQTDISLAPVYNSSAIWGDYDNDGDLDILLSGQVSVDNCVSKIYRNEGDVFTEQNGISLIPVYGNSNAWGDYDNDGDLDILLSGKDATGNSVSIIYRNNGNNTFTEQKDISINGANFGSVAWGDYDNDGDRDIFITGDGTSESIKIYQNKGDNSFLEQSAITLGLTNGSSIAIGDYDNDSYLDILLTEGYSPKIRIYRNTGDNFFSEQSAIPLIVNNYNLAVWGDFENDGDLDILFSGNEFKIYENDGNNTFPNLTNLSQTNATSTILEYGDYDNDGDLDILLAGSDGNGFCRLYKNNAIDISEPLYIPQNLNAIFDSSGVIFNWEAPINKEKFGGLTYEMRIGSFPGGCDIRSSQSLSNGKRLLPEPGMIQTTNYTLKLRPGKYYWSVQSIDHTFTGSEFLEEKELIIDCGTSKPELLTLEVCKNQNISNELEGDAILKWYSNEKNQTPFHIGNTINFVSEPGTYKYYVTQTIDGCESRETGLSLTVKPNTEASEIDKVITSSCSSSDGSITIYPDSQSLQYSIDGGENFQNSNLFSGLSAGIYEIRLLSENSCFYDTTVNLSSSTFNIDAPNIDNYESCYKSTLKFSFDSYLLEWYDSSFNYLETSNNYSPKENEVGEYIYYAAIIDNYCKSNLGEFKHRILELPSARIEEGDFFEKCAYDTLSITLITDANSFEWTPHDGLSSMSENSPDIYCSESTKYKILFTGENGCSDSVNLHVNIKPTPGIPIINGRETVCYNEQNILYNVNLENNSKYYWNAVGGILREYKADSVYIDWDKSTYRGLITLLATDLVTNCSTPESELIINKSKTAPDKMHIKLKGEYILYIEESGAYQWYANGVPIEGAKEKWLHANQYSSEEYQCLLTSHEVCETLSYPFSFAPNKNDIHSLVNPNPVKNRFTISIPKEITKNKAKVEIVNLKGVVFFSVPIEENEVKKEINVTKLNEGIYICRVRSGEKIISGKFTKISAN